MKVKTCYLKNFLMSMILFSIPMSIIFSLLYQSMVTGVSAGLISGVLFSGMMYVVSITLSGKMKKTRDELSNQHTIYCEGAANHFMGKEGVGGWLFLIEDGLYFVAHQANIQVHTCNIPFTEFNEVKKGKTMNSMHVLLKDGKEEVFIVNDREQWIKQLKKFMSGENRI